MTRPARESSRVVETPGGERIDQLVSVIRIRAWLAVLALALVAASGVAWTLLGQVRSMVEAGGVLIVGDGPRPVGAPVGGSLAEVLVRAGDAVTPGTPLAMLIDPEGARHTVRSSTGGVVTRTSSPGSAVGPGSTVAVVDPAAGPLRALLLVGRDRVGALAPGQHVRVGLAGGVGEGTVSAVAPYPVTAEELRDRFGAALVADGPGHLVTVDLGMPAWRDATLSPALAEITIATVRPIDALLFGGRNA